jgi:esterase/lipase superfamily enzyme
MWDQMRKTDFQARAKLLADEINDYQLDVIGIQEATIWRCQKNLWSKKTTVYDFVEIMLKQLSGKYEVAEFENTKAYNPGFSISPIPYLTKVNDPEVFQKIFSQDSAFCGFETGDALIVKKQLQPAAKSPQPPCEQNLLQLVICGMPPQHLLDHYAMCATIKWTSKA